MPKHKKKLAVLAFLLSPLLNPAVAAAPYCDTYHAEAGVCGDSRGSEEVSFNRDIRPILVRNCFGCHGDAGQLEGNVLLKTFDDAIGLSGFEAAIIPGDSAASPLYRRVSAKHEELRMPPVETGRQLSAEEIAKVQRWIDDGAVYEEHWSYRPVIRPEVPAVDNPAWVINPIDAFILSRIEERGLQPSPVADSRTLLRRLHFDLHGLMPQLDQLSRYDAVASDNEAYLALLEELLSSPHYGERMALPWLDWVKYSDEISNVGNFISPFYLYRNYVIDAFNQNKPFDRFTIEQLAGDLLPEAGREQLIASAYNHLIVRIQDGIGYEAIHKYITERVDKLGEVWLASSLECAQCHDHKFDPYLQKDYYQLAAYFSDVDRVGVWSSTISGDATEPRNPESFFKFPRVYLPTDEQKTRLEEIEQELLSLFGELETAESRQKIRDIDQALRERQAQKPDYFEWISPENTSAVIVSEGQAQPMRVESAMAPGGNRAIVTNYIQYLYADEIQNPGTEYRVELPLSHDKVGAVMVRLSSDRRVFNLAGTGPIKINQIEAFLRSGDDADQREPVRFALVESTDLGMTPTQYLVDGDFSTEWVVHPEDIFHKYRYERKDDLLLKSIHNEVYLVFYPEEPITGRSGSTLEVVIHHAAPDALSRKLSVSYTPLEAASPFQHHAANAIQRGPLMRRLRQGVYDFLHKHVFFSDFMDFTASSIFSWTAVKAGVSAPVPFNDIMKSTLATFKEKLALQEIHRDHLVLRHPDFRETGVRIRNLEREKEKLWGEIERTWKTESSRRQWTVRVFAGGEPMDRTGEIVGRDVPGFLKQTSQEGGESGSRLELAEWLVSPDNPLTARVIVNRFWQLFMGEAIVRTTEDFGSGGELPTHPELLDWLASEFVDSGWDIKHIVRLIVESATYRQQSISSDELWNSDPENRLFARQGRFRIDAEFIQDYILQIGGLLTDGIGGEHTSHDVDKPGSIDADQYRRAIYLLRKNVEVPPELLVFGARPRVKSVIHRPSNITALQALAGLNQPLRIKAANRLADEILNGSDDLAGDEKLERLYLRVLQREPTAKELELFRQAGETWANTENVEGSVYDSHDFWVSQARTLMSVREATLRT